MRRTLQALLPVVLLVPQAPAQFLSLKKAPEKVLRGCRFLVGADSFSPLSEGSVGFPKGTAELWIWCRNKARVTVTVGEDRFPSEALKGKDGLYAWRRLGRTEPDRKKIKISSSGKQDTAAVCLCYEGCTFQPDLWPLAWIRPGDPTPVGDGRPSTCRHLNQAFKTYTFPDKEAWEKRAAYLRRHILVACGLWPPPQKLPLRPQIFGRIERENYTVEKVFFESWPGFYVTGNLYRPKGRKGPFPGVLCPHGHWRKGRFSDEGEPKGGVPQRAITLAKLGFVVFTYDMVGYGDSARQMKHTFASPENELWGNSLMKLQLWNAIRGIDFLCSLPDVDPDRIGCTGASGGGTQTFMLMAIDKRVKVASPVNMISAFMQGGCECENAPLLRIDTINPEIAALMAPRPLLMVSATGDWTSHTPQVEHPMVRSIYALYGARDRVKNVHIKAPHNYNRASREAMYRFFVHYLQGKDLPASFREPPYTIEKYEDLSVWAGRDLPPGAVGRKELERFLIQDARRRLTAFAPRDPKRLERFRRDIGSLWRHVMAVDTRLDPDRIEAVLTGRTVLELRGIGALTAIGLIIKRGPEQVPAVLYSLPRKPGELFEKPATAILVHPEGKAALLDPQTGRPGPYISALLKAGVSVLAVDVFLTGEFHSPFHRTVRKKIGRYFTTYNRTTLVERVRDIVAALRFVEGGLNERPIVIGLGRAGRWALLAGPSLPEEGALGADLKGYASEREELWLGEDFAPSILAAGALKCAAALTAPRRLVLFNVGPQFQSEWPLAAYRSADAPDNLTVTASPLGPEDLARAVVED